MAEEEGKLSIEERVRRSVGRTIRNWALVLALLTLLTVWGSFGAFTLKPGQAAVLMLLGRHTETITADGFHLRLPPPLVTRVLVNFSELRNEDFGFRGREDENTPGEKLLEATMQTSDNNIVRVSFAVQYTINDPFLARFRVADPVAVVRDSAQAAMREVVGRMTVDGVLREQRALVTSEVSRLLQDILDSYEAGLEVEGVQLQEVQPPGPVRAAFDDVVAANQDASRSVNEAEGYRNQLLPNARAEAAELFAAAEGYREARIAEATGEATRFMAIAVEYHKAPAVTEKRLYLETMETILPNVETVIIEPGTTQIVPYLPLGRSPRGVQP
ncbi:MAG: FtsH protease activity modulator HflK [Myxococcota bacterium]